jgi:predicted RNA-binding Zn ribbon-like protein
VDLVVAFLNTIDARTFRFHGEQRVATETLTSVEALSAWLSAHDLTTGRELEPADLDTAVALRTALRNALTDGPATAALAGFPLHLVRDPGAGLRLAAAGPVPGLNAIVELVASSLAGGGWARLKLCAADDCRWAFYDASRNGGGRWCRMETCGNRHKTRAYRRRHTD